jgi:hypothetical protein
MMSFKTLITAWDNFFFKPQPVDNIALFRIFWCLMLLANALIEVQNVKVFYGPDAITSFETVQNQFSYPHLNLFHFFQERIEVVYMIFAIYITSLIFALVGFYTQYALALVFVCLTSLHQRNIWLLSSSELVMRIVTLLLIFSPCAHAFSIDVLKNKKNPFWIKREDFSPWVLRLLQIQLSIIYLWTVWHKLKGDNWVDGSAVYYATRLDSMKNISLPYILDSVLFLKLATWGTLVIEFLLGTLIWFREFRKPLIICGIFFHLLIEVMMTIPFFEILMILLLLLFIPLQDVQAWVKKFQHIISPTSRRLELIKGKDFE